MPKQLINVGTKEDPKIVDYSDVDRKVYPSDIVQQIPDEENGVSYVDLTKDINSQPSEQL